MKADPERILKLVLQINGWIMASAVFAVFLSHDQMVAIHQWLGLGKFPDAKIVDYLARSLSGFYTIIGVLYIALARDIHAYASIITLAAWASICLVSVQSLSICSWISLFGGLGVRVRSSPGMVWLYCGCRGK